MPICRNRRKPRVAKHDKHSRSSKDHIATGCYSRRVQASTQTSNPSISGMGIYFYGKTLQGPFKRLETTTPLEVGTIFDGIFCLTYCGFQQLPSQCRGLAFMREECKDDWRLSIVRNLDIVTEKISYYDWTNSPQDFCQSPVEEDMSSFF